MNNATMSIPIEIYASFNSAEIIGDFIIVSCTGQWFVPVGNPPLRIVTAPKTRTKEGDNADPYLN